MSILRTLTENKAITPPEWVHKTLLFECILGSWAYGISDEQSDQDVRGMCLAPKRMIFPHTHGHIHDFSTQVQGFNQWQAHHVQHEGQEYDFEVYNLVRFMRLAMEGNPSLLEYLFVPRECVTYAHGIARRVRDARSMFLHQGCAHKFRGFSYQMFNKLEIKNPKEGSCRAELVEQHGYDTKFATHGLRLLLNAVQIMVAGELNLRANADELREVRAGKRTLLQVKTRAAELEATIEAMYGNPACPVPHSPPEKEIQDLLATCLAEHFGSIQNDYTPADQDRQTLDAVVEVLKKHGSLI